jgi:hypothetical protein
MSEMEYIRVQWLQERPDFPIWIFSELDSERMEMRKVEVFPDGSKGYADESDDDSGRTGLGYCPVPSLAEIAQDPVFIPQEISREEFEQIWNERAVPAMPGQFR